MKLLSAPDLLKAGHTEPGWLIDDFWPAGAKGWIAGPPKSMKSMLAMALAYAVAADRPFLGQLPQTAPRPVLYIQSEMPEWLVADRLAKLAESHDDINPPLHAAEGGIYAFDFSSLNIAHRLHFLWPDPARLMTGALLTDITAAIRQVKPILIIIDPLYSFTNSDMVSNSEIHPILAWLDRIKQIADEVASEPTSLAVVHHNAKASKTAAGKAMLGSVFLHGWAESAWYVKPTSAGSAVHREFRAYPPLPPITCQFGISRPGKFGFNLKAR